MFIIIPLFLIINMSCTISHTQFEPLSVPTTALVFAPKKGESIKKNILSLNQFVFIDKALYAIAKIDGFTNTQLVIQYSSGWYIIPLPDYSTTLIAISNINNKLAILAAKSIGFWKKKEQYNIYVLQEKYKIYRPEKNVWEKLFTMPDTPNYIPTSFSSSAEKIWINMHNTKMLQNKVYFADTIKNIFIPTDYLYAIIAKNARVLWAVRQNMTLNIIDIDDEIIIPIETPLAALENMYISLHMLAPYNDELAYYVDTANKLYSIDLVKKGQESEEEIARFAEISTELLPKVTTPLFCGFLDENLIVAHGARLYKYLGQLEKVTIGGALLMSKPKSVPLKSVEKVTVGGTPQTKIPELIIEPSVETALKALPIAKQESAITQQLDAQGKPIVLMPKQTPLSEKQQKTETTMPEQKTSIPEEPIAVPQKQPQPTNYFGARRLYDYFLNLAKIKEKSGGAMQSYYERLKNWFYYGR